MVQARKNPANGRYVLYVGDSRGLSYYVAGVRGFVDLFAMPVSEFQKKFSENYPSYVRQVTTAISAELPEGWSITAKAGEQLSWVRNLIRKNPQFEGEVTMSEKKSQPKLSAGTKPKTGTKAPAAETKPAKAPAAETKPAKSPAASGEESTGKGKKCPYAGMKITVVSKDIAAKEGTLRHDVLVEILKAKKVDDILGLEVTGGDGKTAKINTAWLSFAQNAGLVSFG
jgi:hypothetical protein